jgi:hypothetical protein
LLWRQQEACIDGSRTLNDAGRLLCLRHNPAAFEAEMVPKAAGLWRRLSTKIWWAGSYPHSFEERVRYFVGQFIIEYQLRRELRRPLIKGPEQSIGLATIEPS